MAGKDAGGPINIRVGREELVVRQRYEVASICNDILVAVWFVVGSVLFFFPAHTDLGTWFFLAGSLELLVRPVIRLSRHVHLRRISPTAGVGAVQDF